MSLPKKTFRGFKRPKGVRGTSGRPVNIDFRFLRTFLRIDALLEIDFRGVHATPFFRLDYSVSVMIDVVVASYMSTRQGPFSSAPLQVQGQQVV